MITLKEGKTNLLIEPYDPLHTKRYPVGQIRLYGVVDRGEQAWVRDTDEIVAD
jgi:hypothetical protein